VGPGVASQHEQGRPAGGQGRPLGGGGGSPTPPTHPPEVPPAWDLSHSTPLAQEARKRPTADWRRLLGGDLLGGAVELSKSHTKNVPHARSYCTRTAARSSTPHASSEGI
jgi:hypothetical protein